MILLTTRSFIQLTKVSLLKLGTTWIQVSKYADCWNASLQMSEASTSFNACLFIRCKHWSEYIESVLQTCLKLTSRLTSSVNKTFTKVNKHLPQHPHLSHRCFRESVRKIPRLSFFLSCYARHSGTPVLWRLFYILCTACSCNRFFLYHKCKVCEYMQTEESTDQTQLVTLIEDLQYYLQEVCEKTMILLQTGRNKTHIKKLNLIVFFFH